MVRPTQHKICLKSLGNRITVLIQPNRGPGVARNFGAQRARGDYLAFLDSDDLWFPWTLQLYEEVVRTEILPSFIAGKPLGFGMRASWTK